MSVCCELGKGKGFGKASVEIEAVERVDSGPILSEPVRRRLEHDVPQSANSGARSSVRTSFSLYSCSYRSSSSSALQIRPPSCRSSARARDAVSPIFVDSRSAVRTLRNCFREATPLSYSSVLNGASRSPLR
eukprot:454665-Pleurochrysis_carterae.AAC.2